MDLRLLTGFAFDLELMQRLARRQM